MVIVASVAVVAVVIVGWCRCVCVTTSHEVFGGIGRLADICGGILCFGWSWRNERHHRYIAPTVTIWLRFKAAAHGAESVAGAHGCHCKIIINIIITATGIFIIVRTVYLTTDMCQLFC